MSLKARILPSYTYQDYFQWEGRWELIDGIPFSLLPTPNVKHQRVSGNILMVLDNAIKKSSCSYKVYLPINVKINDKTVVNPDIVIICDDNCEGEYIDFPPNLVVEILSPSTRLKDLHTKFSLYEEFGVKYYVIVDPEINSLKTFKLENDKYREMDSSDGFDLDDSCKINVNFSTVWIEDFQAP